MDMNKKLRLTATNAFPIEPLDQTDPGPQKEIIRLIAKNIFPIEALDEVHVPAREHKKSGVT